ncbi:zinc-binding alcohol dehydrogenase [Zhouia sp. PK063]|uniref:zinc-binding alcohol dehydrogenase n=1 Tax=Zhouia sp. PK063 TaxID=3373602 RepID=UPI0037AF24DC
MKVKEIPSSLYYTAKLANIPAKKIKQKKSNNLPVIVSLTTIPYRLNKVHITVRCLLSQTKQPEKVVLWLHESLKNQIPNSLKILEGAVFEIKYTVLDCPHVKLVPSLKTYPNSIIITSDDDFIYDKNWTSILYETHLKHPKAIITNQSRPIRYDENGNVLPYKNWKYHNNETDKKCTILAIGSSGTLYPPNSLDDQATNSDLFLKLSPKADDLWFKAMAMLHNTEVIQTKNSKEPIPIAGTQKVSLKKENITNDKNKTQWEQLINYFNLKS